MIIDDWLIVGNGGIGSDGEHIQGLVSDLKAALCGYLIRTITRGGGRARAVISRGGITPRGGREGGNRGVGSLSSYGLESQPQGVHGGTGERVPPQRGGLKGRWLASAWSRATSCSISRWSRIGT